MAECHNNLSPEDARRIFRYDKGTGNIYWNEPAGYKDARGYLKIQLQIDGRQCEIKAHRLAFLLETGQWPTEHVDHKNGNTSDNRWVNIREANRYQNQRRKWKRKKTASKYKGVSWHKGQKKWNAVIKQGNTSKHIGSFDDEKDAARAYDEAAVHLWGEWALTNEEMGLYDD